MASFIRAMFGAPEPPAQAPADSGNVEQATAHSANPVPGIQQPYYGNPVPLEASQDADATWYCDWNENYYLVPSHDGVSVLVFPTSFQAETAEGGVEYDTDPRDDETDSIDRLETAARIYERLISREPLSSRLVRFKGRTASGYRLEKLSPGPVDCNGPAGSSSAVALALYQQWALQMLSALSYLHGHGVFLNNVGQELAWLRSDYSLAIASLVNAGCASLSIAGETDPGNTMMSQWSQLGMTDLNPGECMGNPGSAKGDIFDWATWVYRLMAGNQHPLKVDLKISGQDRSRLLRKREREVKEGEFDSWPVLEDKMLGAVLVEAWRGQFDNADQVFAEVKTCIERSGNRLSRTVDDEIDGYYWDEHLEVVQLDNREGSLILKGEK